MPDKQVFVAQDVPFHPVAWGRSKVLVSTPANGAKHVRVGVTEYHPGTPHEPHSHPGQEEVIWVLSGQGYTESHGKKMDLFPGAVAFIPAAMEHKTVAVGDKMTAIIIKGPVADATGKVT